MSLCAASYACEISYLPLSSPEELTSALGFFPFKVSFTLAPIPGGSGLVNWPMTIDDDVM